MGSFSIWHWIIVLILVLVLFGRGRISEVMGDFGKGIKSFKKGIADAEEPASPPAPPRIESAQQPTETSSSLDKTGQN